jgi:hypothetical protein
MFGGWQLDYISRSEAVHVLRRVAFDQHAWALAKWLTSWLLLLLLLLLLLFCVPPRSQYAGLAPTACLGQTPATH